jgi:hypothetical protein
MSTATGAGKAPTPAEGHVRVVGWSGRRRLELVIRSGFSGDAYIGVRFSGEEESFRPVRGEIRSLEVDGQRLAEDRLGLFGPVKLESGRPARASLELGAAAPERPAFVFTLYPKETKE